jgi:hypothetical protein
MNTNSSSSWPGYSTDCSKPTDISASSDCWHYMFPISCQFSGAYITPVKGPVYHFTTQCVSYSERQLEPLHKSQCQITFCQPSMPTYSKHSPVTNTCVRKSVSSHISLCTPCVYVLACILRMFLGIGGHNSVRHHTAPDIGTAVLLRTDPKLGQTTSEIINTLLWSKQPCVLETQMKHDLRFPTQCCQGVNWPRMWCCHWVNKSLKHHSAFIIIRPRHLFLHCSTSEDEGTMNLQNGGKYSPTDSVKSQKT